MSLTLYPQKEPQYPLTWRLAGPQKRYGLFGKENNMHCTMQSIGEMAEDTGNLRPKFQQLITKCADSRSEAFNLYSGGGRLRISAGDTDCRFFVFCTVPPNKV